MIRRVGNQRRGAPGLGGWWDDFLRYNSADAWGSALGSAYGWLQYGNVPPLVEPAAGETPLQIAERQRAVIEAAERSGSWSPDPRMGITATQVAETAAAAAAAADKYKWVLMGGAVLLGYVALRVSLQRRTG